MVGIDGSGDGRVSGDAVVGRGAGGAAVSARGVERGPRTWLVSAAEEYLSFAFEHCHRSSQKNKRMILIYLLPVKMLLVSDFTLFFKVLVLIEEVDRILKM